MNETITLQLPERVMERARALAENSGRPLEKVLVQWLEQASADWESQMLAEGVHTIYTPVGSDATAEALGKILEEHQTTKKRTDKIDL
jgi:hypothetical protein